MKIIKKLMLLLCIFLIAAPNCKKETKEEESGTGKSVSEKQIKEEVLSVSKSINSFALDLYAQLSESEGNLFFSPFSISTALAMTYAGARGNTEKQMAEVMYFNLKKDMLNSAYGTLLEKLNSRSEKGEFKLSIANALWGQKGYGFLDEFLKILSEDYRAELKKVDFKQATEAVRLKINDWVAKETEEKIKNLLARGTLSSLTRLVLTNAIYFKGDWLSQFKEENTTEMPFMIDKSEKVKTPMMRQKEKFNYVENEKMQALELPYKGEELSMIVLLPKQIEGVINLEDSLTMGMINRIISNMHEREVTVFLPKFEMKSEFKLSKALSSLGMQDAFSIPPADFSGMNGRKDLFISSVIHKAYVKVNEEGSEAAAATGVVVEVTSARHQTIFRADHPFLFMIRDKQTGSILFIGRLVNPEE